MWAGQDSDLRRLTPADLQSAPVDRFGTDPLFKQISINFVNTYSFYII